MQTLQVFPYGSTDRLRYSTMGSGSLNAMALLGLSVSRLPEAIFVCLQVYPHGSTDSLPYCTMGSGSLNAMAVFEDGFKEDMDVEEAKKLVARAIRSGIYNDLGSGSNVDLCVIYKDKVW